MWHFIQPVVATLIGVAIGIFGILNTFALWPATTAWTRVVAATPALLEVALVLACVTLAAAGIAMVVSGIHRARSRFAQLRRLGRLGQFGRVHDDDEGPLDDPREQWA